MLSKIIDQDIDELIEDIRRRYYFNADFGIFNGLNDVQNK